MWVERYRFMSLLMKLRNFLAGHNKTVSSLLLFHADSLERVALWSCSDFQIARSLIQFSCWLPESQPTAVMNAPASGALGFIGILSRLLWPLGHGCNDLPQTVLSKGRLQTWLFYLKFCILLLSPAHHVLSRSCAWNQASAWRPIPWPRAKDITLRMQLSESPTGYSMKALQSFLLWWK